MSTTSPTRRTPTTSHEFAREAKQREAEKAREDAERRQQQKKAAEEAEWRYQQQLLELRGMLILPAIRRWCTHVPEDFNPLCDPCHAYWLLCDLWQRGVSVEIIPQGKFLRVRLTAKARQGWISGEGVSDLLGEAVTLAWYAAYGDTE
jgi:hypothetical protein